MRRCELAMTLVIWHHTGRSAMPTFVESREYALYIGMDFRGWRLPQGEIALADVARGRPCSEGTGQRFAADMFVGGPPVNVNDIARAMFHRPHSGCSDQTALVSAVRGASRTVGRKRTCVAKRGLWSRLARGRERAMRCGCGRWGEVVNWTGLVEGRGCDGRQRYHWIGRGGRGKG
jgi:hypothetical protein